MPARPLKPCTFPGCPNRCLSGPCPEHRAQRDRQRGSATSRGYGGRWPERRQRHLKRFPFCVDCGDPATDVDHEPPRKDLVARGVPDPDAEMYLNSRCHSCHSRKTANQNRLGGAVE